LAWAPHWASWLQSAIDWGINRFSVLGAGIASIGLGVAAILSTYLVPALISRKRYHRLKTGLDAVARGEMSSSRLLIEASSVAELEDWLLSDWSSEVRLREVPQRDLLADIEHARGLSRALIVGKEQPGTLPRSSLAVYLAEHPDTAVGYLQSIIEARTEGPLT